MFDVNKAIYACDDVICRNIESFTTEQRGLLMPYLFLNIAARHYAVQ